MYASLLAPVSVLQFTQRFFFLHQACISHALQHFRHNHKTAYLKFDREYGKLLSVLYSKKIRLCKMAARVDAEALCSPTQS